MSIFVTLEPRHSLRGIVIQIPGLNIRSQAFGDLGQFLSQAGFRVLTLELTGHNGLASSRSIPSAQRWKDEVLQALETATAHSGGTNVHILAYSLGAALATCVVGSGQAEIVSRMVFLAPALRLLWWTHLPRPLTHSALAKIPLPSFLPKRYQAANFTAVCWYRALFDLCEEASQKEFASHLNAVPTLTLLSRRDEFMRPKAIQTWIEERNLSQWQVEEITPHPITRLLPHHLIIDRHSLGPQRWEMLTARIDGFLR